LNYVATEESILFVLNRSDFMKVLAENPNVLQDLRKIVRDRLTLAREMTDEDLVRELIMKGII
jgi:CRP-like cAMP-binding protein